jgi:hypothetical protein
MGSGGGLGSRSWSLFFMMARFSRRLSVLTPFRWCTISVGKRDLSRCFAITEDEEAVAQENLVLEHKHRTSRLHRCNARRLPAVTYPTIL